MKTKVQKWGNSLALRIPQALAIEMGLADKTPVEMAVIAGRLVVAPAAEATKTQHQQLLALLQDAPADTMGAAWWAEFEQELAAGRLSFRPEE